MNPALEFFNDMPWGVLARQQQGVFYACETLHFVGLCLLLGALLLVDLRLLGFWRGMKLPGVFVFMRFALVGFAINAVTGFVMFCADPYNYWTNPAFQIKVVLIALAGLNLVWFLAMERRRVLALPDGADTGAATKLSAGLSLILWILIIIAGRLLPSYEGAGGIF